MTFKLIALDIDGTIRAADHPITERTTIVLRRARDAGAVVTIATGRSFHSAVAATAELELEAPIASFQGAHLADPRTGEVLWHRPLTERLTRKALGGLGDWDGDVMAFIGDEVFVSRMTDWSATYGARQNVSVHVVGDLGRIAERRPTRLVVAGDEDRIERLESDLIGRFGGDLHVTRSLPYFCEILHPAGGKHRALEALCARLGVPREDTLAFGNGYNDVHMLRWVGLGVAVEGAVSPALDAADMIAPSVERQGPAQVLEGLLADGKIGTGRQG